MNTSLRNKLIEIAFDRLLLGLLIGAAALLTNMYLERYRLEESQRVSDTSEFVAACAEAWAGAGEFEDGLNKLDRLRFEQWLTSRFQGKADAEIEARIATQEELNENYLEAFRKAVLKNRYVLDESMAMHFHRYAGFLKMRADAKRSAREDSSKEMRDNASHVVDQMNTALSSMRFTPTSAREYAMQRALGGLNREVQFP